MTAPSDPSAFIARAREALAKATPGPLTVEIERYVSDGRGIRSAVHSSPDDAALHALAVNALPALLEVAERAVGMRNAFELLNDYKEDSDWGKCEDARDALDAALLALAEVPGE